MAILLLVACNRSAPATSTPAATATAITTAALTPEPVATEPVATEPLATEPPTSAPPTVALPTVTASPAPPTFAASVPPPVGTSTGGATGGENPGAIFTSPRFSYTVILPCCWLALPTPGTAIESALADLDEGEGIPLWGDLAQRVRERESGALLELIALLPDDESLALPIAQVTVSVLPTYGMTLDDYAAATSDELTRIANTSVQTAYIEPSLGVEEFPAAVIEYTAAAPSTNDNDPNQSIAGMQVAFFGHDAESLIVLTFTTTVDRFAELQPEFLHIVRTVTLRDPTI